MSIHIAKEYLKSYFIRIRVSAIPKQTVTNEINYSEDSNLTSPIRNSTMSKQSGHLQTSILDI